MHFLLVDTLNNGYILSSCLRTKHRGQRNQLKFCEVDNKYNHEVCHLSERKQSWNEVENSTRSSFMISSWLAQWDQVQLLSEIKENVWEYFWLHSTNIKNSLKDNFNFCLPEVEKFGCSWTRQKTKGINKEPTAVLPLLH